MCLLGNKKTSDVYKFIEGTNKNRFFVLISPTFLTHCSSAVTAAALSVSLPKKIYYFLTSSPLKLNQLLLSFFFFFASFYSRVSRMYSDSTGVLHPYHYNIYQDLQPFDALWDSHDTIHSLVFFSFFFPFYSLNQSLYLYVLLFGSVSILFTSLTLCVCVG